MILYQLIITKNVLIFCKITRHDIRSEMGESRNIRIPTILVEIISKNYFKR